MKRIVFSITVFTLLFSLAACSKKTVTDTTGNTTGSLSGEAELVVGTFKLEGTDQAITADQAKKLLPLWQTLQSISQSSTTATEEMNGLVDQIKSTMTAQQVEKITAMKLTQQDVMTVMNSVGVGFQPGQSGASGTPNAQGGTDQQFSQGGGPSTSGNGSGPSFSSSGPSGGPSGGGGPSGAGGPPSGGNGVVVQGDTAGGSAGGPPGMVGTPQAVRGNGFANIVPQPLLNALIDMLKKKIQ